MYSKLLNYNRGKAPGILFLMLFIPLLSGLQTLAAQTAGPDDPVRVYSEQQDDYRILFYADNDLFIPAYVYIDFESLTNLSPDMSMPAGFQLDPGEQGRYLFALEPGEGRQLGFRFSYSYSRGNPETANPDEDFLYLFPYSHGTKQRISQGFNGRFTHMDDNLYAIDFDLEEGTPVLAARAGLVVEIKEDSSIGGTSVQYGPHANYVLILHEDGTFGNYVHLQRDGALVEPGDRVEEGQLIGLSGNTGRSSGPHLHFDVRIPLIDGSMQSIPIRFRGRNGEPIDPQEGGIYYAYHSGGPDFQEVFGSDLSDADFENHDARIAESGRIDFRVEQTDLTYVVFIGNGLPYPVEAEVELRLTGMVSSRESPLTVRLERGQERYLTILRPLEGRSSWRYGYAVSYRPLE